MKTVQITAMLDALSETAFGMSMSEAIATDSCVRCHKPKGEFKDFVSKAEYKITGLCQACQDTIFESMEE